MTKYSHFCWKLLVIKSILAVLKSQNCLPIFEKCLIIMHYDSSDGMHGGTKSQRKVSCVKQVKNDQMQLVEPRIKKVIGSNLSPNRANFSPQTRIYEWMIIILINLKGVYQQKVILWDTFPPRSNQTVKKENWCLRLKG